MKNETREEGEFDCIAFKRAAQEAIYRETRDLGPEEQIAYFRERASTGPLGEWWTRVGRSVAGATPG